MFDIFFCLICAHQCVLAAVILAVKEVPVHKLIPNRTYMFFSHTIKAQEYNMPLLDAVLENNIRLLDYECIVDKNGSRLVCTLLSLFVFVCAVLFLRCATEPAKRTCSRCDSASTLATRAWWTTCIVWAIACLRWATVRRFCTWDTRTCTPNWTTLAQLFEQLASRLLRKACRDLLAH